MDYFEYPDHIKHLLDEIGPYRAHNAEEDRGDGFKEGTPNYILDFRDMVRKYEEMNGLDDYM